MKAIRALASGLAGACALTSIHQAARQLRPDAPRADVLGKRAIALALRAADRERPPASAWSAGRWWATWSPTR